MTRYIISILFAINCLSINLHAQKILYASPDKLQPNSYYIVKIYCSGTHFTSSYPSLKFSKPGFEFIPIIPFGIENDSIIQQMFNLVGNNIPSGIYDIDITDSIDGTMILPKGLEIIGPPGEPKIVSIKPDTCNRGDTITLRVVGQNTFFNANNVQIIAIYSQNDIVATPDKIVYHNDTLMDVSFHLLSKYFGSCDFLYYGNKEKAIKIFGALYVRPPVNPIYISHLSEDTVTRGKSCRFFIYGKSTQFSLITSKTSICLFGAVSTNTNSFTVINDTVIDAEFNIPFKSNGILTLWLNIPTYGQMYLYNCLQVINNPDMLPVILSVTPDTTRKNRWTTMIINCKNTSFTIDNPRVFLTKYSYTPIQADSVFTINDTTLRSVFWIAQSTTPGKWNLMVSNAFDGLFTSDSIITIKKEVGIEVNEIVKSLLIWPNPTKGNINLNLPQLTGNYCLQLIDSKGNLCFSKELVLIGNQQSNLSLDFSFLSAGNYLISMSNGKFIFSSKLVIH
jgi:hypothetical protein